MKIVMKDIFLKYTLSIKKNYRVLIKTYHFYQKEKNKKVEKRACSLEDEEKYLIHIRALKQALNCGLKLKRYTE